MLIFEYSRYINCWLQFSTENIFRAVNIALVNELKVIYGKLEVDIWDVIEAAKTKPFGYMPFYPGPGLGGHCIPIDPFYLAWRAKQVGIETRFIELAGEINTEMPEKVVESVELVLNDKSKKTIDEATILLIGVSYKKNVDDIRESPALVIINRLEQKGAKVEFYDPYIPKIPPTRNYSHLSGKESIDWDCGLLSSFDVVVICADHDQINYQELTEHSKVIIDTRNATAKINEGRSKIIKA